MVKVAHLGCQFPIPLKYFGAANAQGHLQLKIRTIGYGLGGTLIWAYIGNSMVNCFQHYLQILTGLERNGDKVSVCRSSEPDELCLSSKQEEVILHFTSGNDAFMSLLL